MNKRRAYEIAKELWEEAEKNKKISYNISHRGGYIGIDSEWLSGRLTEFDEEIGMDWIIVNLPKYYGAGCNYLGGGVRGKIFPSSFNKEMDRLSPKIAKILIAIGNIAVKQYEELESELNLEKYDELGEEATKIARKKGIISAY